MKKHLLIGTLVILSGVSHAQTFTASNNPSRPEFQDVVRTHWAYAAVEKATRLILPQEKLPFSTNRAVTRYEFTVTIASLEDKFAAPEEKISYNVNSARDILAALHREFQDDLTRLRLRDTSLEVRTAGSTSDPHSLHGNDIFYFGR